jgi:hypothetical protein
MKLRHKPLSIIEIRDRFRPGAAALDWGFPELVPALLSSNEDSRMMR